MNENTQPSVFSMPLEQIPRNSWGVPSFIPVVRDYLIKFSGTVGIFRQSGSHILIKDLGVIFACPQCAIPPASGVNEVAGFFSKWLNSLPEPLITPSVVAANLVPDDARSVIRTLQNLPEINRKTAACVFQIMDVVIKKAEINKMNYQNMSTCLVLSLLQNQKRPYNQSYQFHLLYSVGVQLLNEEGNDFILEGPLVEEVINRPYQRLANNTNVTTRMTLVLTPAEDTAAQPES